MWDCEWQTTLRKASFCSRCLLIRGRRWSQSDDIPSLSWLPHQSSSRRYSCSRLSNTLHTWRYTKSQRLREETLCEDVASVAYLFRCLIEGHRCIDKLQAVLHLQHQLLPVNSHFLSTASNCLWIIVTCLQHHLGDRRKEHSQTGICGRDEHPSVAPAWVYLSLLLDLQSALMSLLQRISMEERLKEENVIEKM